MITNLRPDETIYYHYAVGNEIYLNKVEALMAQIDTGLPMTFHMFDKELDALNLFEEPAESIETLYSQRAIQLREDYDHLVLWFSGGADSAKIAEVFIANKLVIDEIHITVRYDRELRERLYDQGMDTEGPEIEQQSIPLANYLKENYWPNLKITVTELKPHLMQCMNDRAWARSMQSTTDPNAVLRSDFDRFNDDWKRMANKGIKIGHLVGKEKPMIVRDDIGFYLHFIDGDITDWAAPRRKDFDPSLPQYKEFFYWHPKTVRMIIKQCHLLRRAYDLFSHIPNMYNRGSPMSASRLIEDSIASVIYGPRLLPTPAFFLKVDDQPIKADSKLLKPQSHWFFQNLSEEPVRNWFSGVNELYHKLRPLYTDKMQFYRRGFGTFKTKPRYFWYHSQG